MNEPLRVLVAEDSENDFELLLRELRKGGYEPISKRVETPEDMARSLEQQTWDIVFSDWSMPQFSAPRALSVLKDAGIDLPFIIVSGTVGEEVAVEALKAGAHDFFLKDKLARLLPAVDRELREAAMRRERNKMHEQLVISDRMASVGILAAGVAHEINNPLTTLLVNLDLASRDISEMTKQSERPIRFQEIAEELSDARAAAERIRVIVRDLKLFSRSDEEQKAAVDIQHAVDSSLRMAWNEIRHRAQLVKKYLPVASVDANESRLGQVFLNLIINAAQSIPEGQAMSNEIRVAIFPAPDGRVVVEISDTGSGMPPEVLKHLFMPFFTTKPIGVGTGLGLSICHRIITSIDGQLTVESTPGKGSCFRVYLLPMQTTQPPTASRTSMSPRAARRGRILVVDDERMIVTAMERTLALDHDVVGTDQARDALVKVIAGERFDVILCDLMMPTMTGMDLHAELLQVAPDQAEKMVFMTGGAFTLRARTFLGEVPNLRFEKPIEVGALRAFINDRLA